MDSQLRIDITEAILRRAVINANMRETAEIEADNEPPHVFS
jgi:hypothetical protein